MHAAALAVILVVRTYDLAGMNPHDAARARQVAGQTLGGAGVETRFIVCATPTLPPPQRPDECAAIVGGATLMIRFLREPKVAGYADVLGDAKVDTAERAGTLATVFVTAVTRLAAEAGISTGTLLGLTMAHEIGHLLLGTAAHEPTGLMRATWTPALLRRPFPREWSFSASQKAELAAGLARRGAF